MLALTINGATEYLPEEKRDDAMLRYWQAKQKGDATANLARVEKIDVPPPPDEPPPTRGGQVSEVARARIRTQEGWLDEAGFTVPPPLFAPGTRVVELGDHNFRAERQRVAAMPRFGDAAWRVTHQITKEERADVRASLHSIEMTEAGLLKVHGQVLPLDLGSFQQLCTLVGFGSGSRYLAEDCDPAMRADNVNYQFERAENREFVFRTRLNGKGQRHIFSTVTPTYAAVDSDAVLEVVSQTLTDAKTEMLYDGSGVRATALWMPDKVVDLAAGDVFKVGVRVETDDTGRGRIRISGVVFRNLCLNLIIIGEGEVETLAQVHRGSTRQILAKLSTGVEQARDKVGKFLEAWGHARKVKVKPEEKLKEWVESRKIQVKGVRSAQDRDALVEALLSSWHKEPGDTLADAVNAVTRTAHEHPLWGVDVREELERQAARLVLVPR